MISHKIKNLSLLYNHLPKKQLRFQINWAILQYKICIPGILSTMEQR